MLIQFYNGILSSQIIHDDGPHWLDPNCQVKNECIISKDPNRNNIQGNVHGEKENYIHTLIWVNSKQTILLNEVSERFNSFRHTTESRHEDSQAVEQMSASLPLPLFPTLLIMQGFKRLESQVRHEDLRGTLTWWLVALVLLHIMAHSLWVYPRARANGMIHLVSLNLSERSAFIVVLGDCG